MVQSTPTVCRVTMTRIHELLKTLSQRLDMLNRQPEQSDYKAVDLQLQIRELTKRRDLRTRYKSIQRSVTKLYNPKHYHQRAMVTVYRKKVDPDGASVKEGEE
ncbi:hypothetical protein Mapa_007517 [Marchantia paleacea]|nr:hypothetical protein Mapa_007517 [Marchantia paleacea]